MKRKFVKKLIRLAEKAHDEVDAFAIEAYDAVADLADAAHAEIDDALYAAVEACEAA